MKSAYEQQTPPPDYELTCVEQGSPTGELLRRYWQSLYARTNSPICGKRSCYSPKTSSSFLTRTDEWEPSNRIVRTVGPRRMGQVEAEGLRCCYRSP
jgi:hypothetical protein